MKNRFLIFFTATLIYSIELPAQISPDVSFAKTFIQDTQWEQSTDGYWVGRNNTLYTFDQFRTLMRSYDGITWEPDPEGWWEDREGNWMTYHDNWLFSSDNMGLTWTNVSGNTWLGWDGNYYRFDENGRLWKRQGAFDENL